MPGAICERKLKPRTDLGRRILLLCEAKGYGNLASAATASGVCYTHVYKIVTGKVDPKWSTLEKIVHGLGGTMEEFFTARVPAEGGDEAVDGSCHGWLES